MTRRGALVIAGAATLAVAGACDLDPGRSLQPELPFPPETEEMTQFTRDMQNLFPGYGVSLEYLRGGTIPRTSVIR
jgi:hypothetical protein